jgi:dihydrodipicolinate synthase/N-acetylneuraminate lyase
MTTSNGIHRPLWTNGPGVPLTTPFKAGLDEIDHEALAKQVVRCAKAGINIVLLGTTGEGVFGGRESS